MPYAPSPPSVDEVNTRVSVLSDKLAQLTAKGMNPQYLTAPLVADFLETELPRYLLPSRFGGRPAFLEAFVSGVIQLARGDGSLAWTLATYGDGALHVAAMSDRAQDDVWKNSVNTLITSDLTAAGNVVPVEGGYMVSGQWSFVPGVDHANWVLLGGKFRDNDKPRRVCLLIPKSQASVSEQFTSSTGLSGTGARTLSLRDVQLPAHRVIDQDLAPTGGLLGLAAVGLGVSKTLYEDFVKLASDSTRRGPRVFSNFATALRIAESKAEISTARSSLLDAARTVDAAHRKGEPDTGPARALTALRAAHAVLSVTRAGDRLFAAGGAKVNMLSSIIPRCMVDIHAIGIQERLAWDSAASPYGRQALGEQF
jgi:alkylation response protein AidB-like acyl-CoA dehydrogenase